MKKFSKVWIVDDDEVCIFLCENQLKKHNPDIAVTTFLNGKAFLDFIKSEGKLVDLPDFIILDINMPLMNGWEVLEELKSFENATAFNIAIVSSSGLTTEKERTKQYSNIRAHVLKPISKKVIDTLALEMMTQ